VLVLGFLALIGIGATLLTLPPMSARGEWTSPLIALFTATSAVCVTGLVVVDTATHWSPAGHVLILVLQQVGGIGFMAGSTLLLFVLVGRRTRLRQRLLLQTAGEALSRGGVAVVVRQVVRFTLLCEAIGALVLAVGFLNAGQPPGTAAWWGIFHSVSAFTNGSFDLTGEFRSMTLFAGQPLVLVTLGILIVLGGLGFAIVGDVVAKRRWRRLALETHVVLVTSAVLLVAGAILIALIEWSNPRTLGGLEPVDRIVNATFISAAARTAGFNAVAIGDLAETTLLIVIALMFIGGASGSTAGGIKVTTFGVLLFAIVSTIRGEPSAVAFGRRIPHLVVYRAISVVLLSIAVAFVVALALRAAADAPLIVLAFEGVSALGTVGMTTGITPSLPDPARLILIGAMFVGRVGPLTLVLALAARQRTSPVRPAVELMRIG
jgi:trk system potassium uptake protein TrkH